MAINISDKLLADHAEEYIMSIRLRSDGLSFSVYNPSANRSFLYKNLDFDRSKPYMSSLKEFFFEHEFLTWSYKRIQVVCFSSQYTLVPKEIYKEDRKNALLNFSFSSPKCCLSNALKDEPANLLFGVEEEVYEFCSRSLVNPCFIHYMTPVFSLLKKQSNKRHPRQLYAILHHKSVDIVCYEQGNLLFVNTFEYEQLEDILYYILYVWKQTGMNQQKDQLRLFGDVTLRGQIINVLRNYLQYIDPLEIPSEAYLMGSDVLQAPLDLIALSLCEL